MKNCPTCNALLKGAGVCRRCKTDLNLALNAAGKADAHYEQALLAHAEERFDEMLRHAKRAFSLRRSVAGGRLLAGAALLEGDYRLALEVWGYLKAHAFSQTTPGS